MAAYVSQSIIYKQNNLLGNFVHHFERAVVYDVPYYPCGKCQESDLPQHSPADPADFRHGPPIMPQAYNASETLQKKQL